MNRLAAFFALVLSLLAPATHGASDRYVYFVSDLHLGIGSVPGAAARLEDFRWDDALGDFLAHIKKESPGKADLVLLGDVFELWQSPFAECTSELSSVGCKTPDCEYPDSNLGCTEAEAVKRLEHILEKHSAAILMLDAFAAVPGNTVTIVPGNHDAALLMPKVRERALKAFPKGSVSIPSTGYWMSADRKVYGDHGHQFDEVNRWKTWPQPTIVAGGVTHMRRPWGENMVQRFYNQYEAAFPVIDNFLDEKAGVQFAIDNVGITPAAGAVGKFLRFFLFQQSLAQFGSALDDGKSPWDLAETRKQAPAFFADVLTQPMEAATLELAVADMSDEELMRICDLKAAMIADGKPGVAACPKRSGNLGAAASAVLHSPETIRKDYLLGIARQLYANKAAPEVYVYGHTHRAVSPSSLPLGDLLNGPASTVIVNTGAFQRVASHAQVYAALVAKRKSNAQAHFQDLLPTDLPDCHTFVRIAPYGDAPVPELKHIAPRTDGTGRAAAGGVCPGN